MDDATLAILEKVVVGGDLAAMTPGERLLYYRKVCEDNHLNPLTQPFDYLQMKNKDGSAKLVLYANKTCAFQLADAHGITVEVMDKTLQDGIFMVQARATKGQRFTEDLGAVSVKGLAGESLANAIMKTMTKAKRRAILSLVGLGFLDETEVETIPGASYVEVDRDTGEIISESKPSKAMPDLGGSDAGGDPDIPELPNCPLHDQLWDMTEGQFGAQGIP